MRDKVSFYILFSKSINTYYSGITTEDIESRIIKHNTSQYGHKYTSAATDWELKRLIPCDRYSIARKTELYTKQMKSRTFTE